MCFLYYPTLVHFCVIQPWIQKELIIMKNNLKILESWLGTCRKYYCKLSGAIGGNDRLDLSFNIVPKDYVPINKYGTYNEPYDSFTITVSHLEKYTQSQMEDLIYEINMEFKSRI